MNLYHVVTIYHLLSAILHYLSNGRPKSTLLVHEGIKDIDKIIEKFNKYGYFEKIYKLNNNVLKSNIDKIDDEIIDKNKLVVKIMENYLDIDVRRYKDIYVAGDQFPFGVYLVCKEKEYIFLEDGVGQESRKKDVVEYVIKDANEKLYKLICEYGLFGENKFVKKKYINFNAQNEDFEIDEKCVDFDVMRLLHELPQDIKIELKDIFNIKNLEIIGENNSLFLAQHSVNMGILTEYQQQYLATLIIDYFADDSTIYVKTHPSDPFTNYELFIDNSVVIKEIFPVELFYLLENMKFKNILTAWSTSVRNLSNLTDMPISFNAHIEKMFMKINRYYVGFMSVLEYLSTNNYSIEYIGANYTIIDNFVKKYKIENGLDKKNKIIFVDDYYEEYPIEHQDSDFHCYIENRLSNASDKDIFVFLNSESEFSFYNFNNNIFDNILEIVIDIKKHEDSLYKEEAEEGIWLFSKDKDKFKELNDFYVEKILKNSKITVSASIPKEDFEIKKLKGMLLATERRLIMEVEENSRLRDSIYINDLVNSKNDII